MAHCQLVPESEGGTVDDVTYLKDGGRQVRVKAGQPSSSSSGDIRHVSIDLGTDPENSLDIRRILGSNSTSYGSDGARDLPKDHKDLIIKESGESKGSDIAESSGRLDQDSDNDDTDSAEPLPCKKAHSYSYPSYRRRAIAPDETDEAKDLDTFHIFSPYYANWQKNYDTLTYYKRRNSLPFNIPDSLEDNYADCQIEYDKWDKPRSWSIFKLFDRNFTRTKNSVSELDEILKSFKYPVSEDDGKLLKFKDLHWSTIWPTVTNSEKQGDKRSKDCLFKNALWELFSTECNFYYHNLLVLKNTFMEPLKRTQVDGFLMDAEPEILFGNLDELCAVTYEFCQQCVQTMVRCSFDADETLVNILINKNGDSNNSGKLKNVSYHKYCLNYLNALNHLYLLRHLKDFNHFEQWCQKSEKCQKRSLSDLLISPVQHCMKIPLIYKNILKRIESQKFQEELESVITEFEVSLRELEEKMKWMKNYKRLQEIENILIWPHELDQLYKASPFYASVQNRLRTHVGSISLANPRRRIIYEGNLLLHEASGKVCESRVFLFDDVILITRTKKNSFKRDSLTKRGSTCMSYEVVNQLIDVDRFIIDDVKGSEETVIGIKNVFMLFHLTKYNEIAFVYIFQTQTSESKREWIKKLRYLHKIRHNGIMTKCIQNESCSLPTTSSISTF